MAARAHCWPVCTVRVAGFTLLSGGPQGGAFASQNSEKRAIPGIIDGKGRPDRAIIGVFPANSILGRREASRS